MSSMRASPSESLSVWADRLQALSRTGLFYANNDNDRERYQHILAIAAEMASSTIKLTPVELKSLWLADPGHVTPRVGIGAVIFDESGKLLLLKRPESSYWALPVGFSEVGETPAQGIAREVREETGLVIHANRILGVYDCRGSALLHQLYNIVFWCAVDGGELTKTAEAPDHGYFDRAMLPALLPHHCRSVADAFAAWHDGWSETAFDR